MSHPCRGVALPQAVQRVVDRGGCLAKLPLLFPKAAISTTAYETHLSALEAHPQTPVRFPGADEEQEWSCHSFTASPAWSQAPAAEGCRNPLRAAYASLKAGVDSRNRGRLLFRKSRPPQGMRLRFPKSARLFRAREFQRLRRDGKSYYGKLMIVSVLSNAGEGAARVGIITSSRVGGAVARNRVRRRIREIVRVERSRLLPGIWLVIVARRPAIEAAFSELRAEWQQLIRRAAILSEP
jgi:ribonuclease P protein component